MLSVNFSWKVEIVGCRIERKRGALVLVSVKEEVKGAAEVLEEEVEGAAEVSEEVEEAAEVSEGVEEAAEVPGEVEEIAEVSEEADVEVVVRVMVMNSARSVVGMNAEKSVEMSARTESVQSVFSLLIEFQGRG